METTSTVGFRTNGEKNLFQINKDPYKVQDTKKANIPNEYPTEEGLKGNYTPRKLTKKNENNNQTNNPNIGQNIDIVV